MSKFWNTVKRYGRINPLALEDFDFGRQLGSGHEATVWEAYPKMGNKVTLQLPRTMALRQVRTVGYRKDQLEQLENGSKIHSKMCVHPNISTHYWTFKDKENYFELVEYLRGKTVEELHFPEDMDIGRKEFIALSIMKEVMEAVRYMHRNGTSHGDICPSNIMVLDLNNNGNVLNDDPAVRLIDFGYAQSWNIGGERSAPKSHKLGYGKYTAPEVLWKAHSESKADIFSVGAVLYFLLLGRPLGPDDSPDNFNFKKFDEPVDDPVWKSISPESRNLIKDCLNHKPDYRPNIDLARRTVDSVLRYGFS